MLYGLASLRRPRPVAHQPITAWWPILIHLEKRKPEWYVLRSWSVHGMCSGEDGRKLGSAPSTMASLSSRDRLRAGVLVVPQAVGHDQWKYLQLPLAGHQCGVGVLWIRVPYVSRTTVDETQVPYHVR